MSSHNDIRLVKYLFLLMLFPLALAMCSGDRFRYPCQDPSNWDKDMCKFPVCDVTRTCPEHIFKGQRDPRLGPPKDDNSKPDIKPMASVAPSQGANCGK
jgi:hypothetical protein